MESGFLLRAYRSGGITLDGVKALQAKAVAALNEKVSAGGDLKTLVHWSAEGMSFAKVLTVSIPQMLDECSAVILWAANDGRASNRVYADFRGFGFTV